MDFHSLARRELQALCKKNKIAANLTNIAMADALKALQHVEGIEEFMNTSESEVPQSPEKQVIGSLDIPRTVCRTSTRRKPIKEESKSSQPSTRTRHGTQAVPSSRKRAPVASARRKTETQEANQIESSVQRVYSTRQSVRLAEKKMAELSLKERGRTEPIKIGDLSKEGSEISDDSDDVQENMGANLQTMSEKVLERTDDSGVLFGRKSNGLMENESDLKVGVKYNNNCEVDDLNAKPEEGFVISDDSEVVSVSDENSNKLIEKERDVEDVEDEAHDENKGADLQIKPEVGCETIDELGENSEKAIDLNDETIEKKGSDDFPVTMVLSDAEKSNEVSKSENDQDLNADQDMGSDDSSTIVVAPPQSPQEIDNSASVVESVNYSSGDSEKPGLNSLNLSAYGDQLVVDGSDDDDDDLPEGQTVCSEQLGIKKEPEIPVFLDCKKSMEDSDQLVTDVILGDDDDDSDEDDLPEGQAVCSEQLGIEKEPEILEFLDCKKSKEDSNQLVMTTTHECPPSLDKTPTSVKQMSPSRPLASDCEIPFSNWAVDPVLGHIPRPTQLTPRKSSSKKQTTIRRVVLVSDNNKENIDDSGRKVEVRIEKGKKIRKDTAEDNTLKSLNEASLRQLNKMLKEKLKIKKDDDNTNGIKAKSINDGLQQAVKTRPALQKLTENCMAAGEPGQEN